MTTLQKTEIIYPDNDGKPIADNTKQFRWIVTIQGGIDALFRDNPDVFVAGDLLWYPVEGNNKIRQAPDIMVVFGRHKGDRGSYQQWKENNIIPQVVFEVLSPGNTFPEMLRKFKFYDNYGVEEYYIYDPDTGELFGYLRSESELKQIEEIQGFISPRLGVRFELVNGELEIYRSDGEKFLKYVELEEQRQLAQEQRQLAEQKTERLAEKLREMGVNPDEL
ncbi:Uma2 family endonuclease [Dolichospermum sp. FACHB-1091]|uniref:Uma2 family endonuclease n=1 Tax=Dolichospermum sp. FACHB-1091 TaxID=2692798 RepID=UPI001680D5D9|nr:Uma2 family endonuclease [Dolichospermum sp. FACHB-1091]MBD2443715.1 Uma2 family endonuclease [Dolichospermum sp. FACHB-1091]